jgi:arylsulfatase A-like enzyme
LRKKTLVVFTSDNGGYLNYGSRFRNISSNGPLRGQKGSVYEGGHRVPMIFSWPGLITPGATGGVAHSTDLFPTFTALAGANAADLELDGVDLSPLLLQGRRLPRRFLFWRAGAQRAVRYQSWKLCVTDSGTELFDLEKDLGEQHDLAGQRPEQVARLKRAWANWNAEVNRSADAYAKIRENVL